jgi:hypothetical protein
VLLGVPRIADDERYRLAARPRHLARHGALDIYLAELNATNSRAQASEAFFQYLQVTDARDMERIQATLKRVFSIDLSTAAIEQGQSSNAPTLWRGRVPSVVAEAGLLDWTQRVLLKRYTVHPDHCTDVADELVIGAAALNTLVTHYPAVVTPHFAYTLDFFVAPVSKTLLHVYELVEYADRPLSYRQEVTDERVAVSLLVQLLFSIEAAYKLLRFCHGDLHNGNVMVRDVSQEPDAAYFNCHWRYVLPDGRRITLPRDWHQHQFVEIIDWDNAQARAPWQGTWVYLHHAKEDNSGGHRIDAEYVMGLAYHMIPHVSTSRLWTRFVQSFDHYRTVPTTLLQQLLDVFPELLEEPAGGSGEIMEVGRLEQAWIDRNAPPQLPTKEHERAPKRQRRWDALLGA